MFRLSAEHGQLARCSLGAQKMPAFDVAWNARASLALDEQVLSSGLHIALILTGSVIRPILGKGKQEFA